MRHLLRYFRPEVFPFDRTKKLRMCWRLLQHLRQTRPDLVVMEGTGLAGGAALVLARILFRCRYVVSSGDAVGPWVGAHIRILGPIFGLYERILCRLAAGFIAWTPYLAGRALTFGTRRVITAAGWAPFVRSPEEQSVDRIRARERLGIPTENLVIGIAGSMAWLHRYRYCYGWELVEAARRITRPNVSFLLIGDGPGRRRLESRARGLPNGRVIFTGQVEQNELSGYYASMDIGSLPQSVDAVGSFRYTTKLSEYLAFRLPVITGQTPLSYDLDNGWLWRLPGDAPWSQEYVLALAQLIDRLSSTELADKRAAVPALHPEFNFCRQAKRVTAFVSDLLAGAPGHLGKVGS